MLATTLLVVAAMLVAAAISDLRRLWIPDFYALGIALAYGVAATQQTWQVALGGVGTAALVFGAGLALFARGWFGGGDVKLLTSVALWAGPGGIADLLFDCALAGAVLALVMLAQLRWRTPAAWRVHAPLQQSMPFGVAIAAAGLLLMTSRWPAA